MCIGFAGGSVLPSQNPSQKRIVVSASSDRSHRRRSDARPGRSCVESQNGGRTEQGAVQGGHGAAQTDDVSIGHPLRMARRPGGHIREGHAAAAAHPSRIRALETAGRYREDAALEGRAAGSIVALSASGTVQA